MTNSFPKNTGRFSAFRSALTEAGKAAASSARNDRPGTAESTHLERRVLAHERILQSLICHLAQAEPAVLSRLKSSFGKGHNLGEYEQDHTSTEHYGDNFIRSVEALMEDEDDSGRSSRDTVKGDRT